MGIVNIINKLSKFLAFLAGLLMIAASIMIISEIIMRSLFSKTLYITSEYTAYFMVFITFLGLAYTLKDGEHIQVDILNKLFKGDKSNFVLKLYIHFVGLFVSIIAEIAVVNLFLDSIQTGTRAMQLSHTYLAIPQSGLVIGCTFLILQFISEIIKIIIDFKNDKLQNSDKLKTLGR